MLTSVVALLPVVAFLVLLVVFDSFKLVPKATIATALAAGAAAALLASLLHGWLLETAGLPTPVVVRYVAPITEESLKLACLVYPLLRRQIGFLVDAAIIGFAVGAGFAVVENLEYLRHLPDGSVWLWIARGFGAAMLHGMATATVATAAKALIDLGRPAPVALVPGWIVAVAVHAVYNRTLLSPLLSAAMLMVVLPIVMAFVFTASERRTREWIGDGLDLDLELLRIVTSGAFGGTRLGRYLTELRSRFPGLVVADMFCLLRLDLELSIRAKGMLMARDEGLEVPVDDALRAMLAERAYLEKSIGPTGLLALRPLQVTGDRDRWHRYLLTNG
ncbi:MAG TPA: PrsW family glutamic-type intramembrane protease [Vicinamibacterales bacterium]|nr:PrsW family glutamic-type intramembrane protease [Vicinamibacterales bacterium]